MRAMFPVDLLARYTPETGHRLMVRIQVSSGGQGWVVPLAHGIGAQSHFLSELALHARDRFDAACNRAYAEVNKWLSVGSVSLDIEDVDRASGKMAA